MPSKPTPTDPLAESAKNAENDVLVLGCGYLGSRVAQAAAGQKNRIYATTRNRQRAQKLAKSGFHPLFVDWTDRRTLSSLPDVPQILVAVSYDRNSRHRRYQAQLGGLRNLLDAVSSQAKICYISTTGVYHQSSGEWVDERSTTRPTREAGRVHLQAEQLLHRLRPDSPWTILRLAGIYGPGRVPRAADVVAGRVIHSPATGYLNLIHVADATRAVLASWRTSCQRMYVVSDDEPVVRGDFYREIACRCHAPPPRFADPAAGAAVAVRSESNKRVWNRRLKRDLVAKLTFPTYRQGLADVLGIR